MTSAQILINQISFNLPSGKAIFDQLSLAFSKRKTGLVGKNGAGKSTLLKLILNEIQPSVGSILVSGKLAYVPQKITEDFSFDATTVAGVLGYGEKIQALNRISQGSVDEKDFSILNDDWNIEEQLKKQLTLFKLESIPLDRPLNMQSGGEVTRLLLVKAFSSEADFLILDEPTNHLDQSGRELLYEAIRQWPRGLIVVSHDRSLLNLMEEIIEISSLGVSCFGGNYDFYKEQKEYLTQARHNQLAEAKHFLEKTKRSIQLTREKHEQRQSKGKELRKRGGQPKIVLDAMENRSTKSQGSFLIRHERMTDSADEKLRIAKAKIEEENEINVTLTKTSVPQGKIILSIENLNFCYSKINRPLINNFSLTIQGPERLALLGNNGSGKTTLIKLILGELQPNAGKIYIGTNYVKYLDQKASLLNPELSILENFLLLNPDAKEVDAYRSLAKFLFRNVSALKLVKNLSGGETLRVLLACVLMSQHPPQLLILDEPTNHLDLSSIQKIESALQNYQGAMIVISHDQAFLKAIKIDRFVNSLDIACSNY